MRHEDWPIRMEQAISRHEGKAFRYGRFDCVIFCADVIEDMTGEYPHSFVYSNKAEAEAIFAEYGSLGSIVSTLFESIPPKMAKRGDLVMVEQDGGSLGICIGSRVVLPARPEGLARVGLDEAIAAWKVQ